MSQQRMKFLLANITFDDLEERGQCCPSDRFAAARKLFKGFNRNCSNFLYPSEFLSLDETLYLMRHQIAFREYNPNNPHWYGLLDKSSNDARVPFTYKAAPYGGTLLKNLLGRNISTDRLYTSISLANWLL